MNRDLLVGDLEFGKMQEVQSEPLTVRVLFRIVLLALFVRDQSSALRVDQEDTAGL